VYTDWDESAAATLLGIEPAFLKNRARRLGGVFDDDPPHEPYHWDTHDVGNKAKQKSKPARGKDEKRAIELSSAWSLVDGKSKPADDADGGASSPDVDQGGDASDDDQSGNGEHLQSE